MSDLVLTRPSPYDLHAAMPGYRFLAFDGSDLHGYHKPTLFKTFRNAKLYAQEGVSGFSENKRAAVLLFQLARLTPVLSSDEAKIIANRPFVEHDVPFIDGASEHELAERMVVKWAEYAQACRRGL
jgi:hypothetical protein